MGGIRENGNQRKWAFFEKESQYYAVKVIYRSDPKPVKKHPPKGPVSGSRFTYRLTIAIVCPKLNPLFSVSCAGSCLSLRVVPGQITGSELQPSFFPSK